MAVRLRIRLFLVVAVLLGVSITISALLSRRATLVEVSASPATGGSGSALERRRSIPLDGVTVAAAARLEQVFRNLLSNAVRHTPAGGSIGVEAAPVVGALRVVISDSGCGVDPAHLPRLFDRFYRADRSRARATGGAGFGLAIVRQLVAAHGGTVTAESDGPGKGARFTVTLPT